MGNKIKRFLECILLVSDYTPQQIHDWAWSEPDYEAKNIYRLTQEFLDE